MIFLQLIKLVHVWLNIMMLILKYVVNAIDPVSHVMDQLLKIVCHVNYRILIDNKCIINVHVFLIFQITIRINQFVAKKAV